MESRTRSQRIRSRMAAAGAALAFTTPVGSVFAGRATLGVVDGPQHAVVAGSAFEGQDPHGAFDPGTR
jgi:hypothetical protein